ncbi:aldehyde ferredoxin oxidoreductase family protein [Natranaerofaba carboxydovora]|uniref:aldehyde ferredoxin oxidoreductase family protein n=1 Tax=Natranaerofaba carboxydovora TaxID=2742683 RepID=UPI001F12DC05|nr:aldehyde ferredoxin oxidoreductase C-terminal domain-containing protein [Natranaerofaba carboxydovora]UMZ74234.1 putative oxidoreductase YdhV [Natranaerofaba carboxydovora]
MNRVIRVNMSDLTVKEEELSEKLIYDAGRGLTSKIVCEEVPPKCHPLGDKNKLVFSPGMVTGTKAPCSGRISVGAKSPLTGGIKESNAGTPTSQKIARLGIKAIIIEGMPEDDSKFYKLKIDKDSAELLSANEIIGKGMEQTNKHLISEYGEYIGIIGVGPAGEMRLSAAGICFNDPENRASRYAGRGGLGAVMGSKGLRAIIVDETDAPGVKIQDKELFNQGQKKLVEAIRNHDLTKPGGVLNAYGTSAVINVMSEVGALPVRNFSKGRFEGAEKTSGEAIAEAIEKRGGGMTGHGCHPGCIIRCSNVYPRPDGSEHVSCIEYESDWAFGANCEIDNLDDIAELIRLCNDIGLDTIETGAAVGVAMEADVIPFGDGKKAIKLLEEIEKGTPLGRIIGSGASVTGQVFSQYKVPTVKKQSMPAYDPRGVKGIGVTYSTSPMGADHTAGYAIAAEIFGVTGKLDPLTTEGKVELSQNLQISTAFLDSTGYCLFIAFAIMDIEDGFIGVLETINGLYGTSFTAEDVSKIGMDIISEEREFNRLAGFNEVNDRLPEFMKEEELPPHNNVFDISDSDLDKVWDENK